MRIRKIVCVLLTAVLLLTIAACEKKDTALILEYRDGIFVNDGLGLSYTPAPDGYEARYIDDLYAENSAGNITFHKIGNNSTKHYIADSHGGLFYGKDAKLPTVGELGADTLYICSIGKVNIALETVKSEESCAKIIDEWLNGKAVTPSSELEVEYKLRFYSADYPAMYITFSLHKSASGTYYMTDGTSDRYVTVTHLIDIEL